MRRAGTFFTYLVKACCKAVRSQVPLEAPPLPAVRRQKAPRSTGGEVWA